MPQIVNVKSPLLAAITDAEFIGKEGYVTSLRQAYELAAEYGGLTVADMPMAIKAMAKHPEVRKAIRPGQIDTLTGEYHGERDGEPYYETWHSVGSLTTPEGLEKAFSSAYTYARMKIDDAEWVAAGKGKYNGLSVARFHLDDVKKGRVPSPGTPYTIFVRLSKDNPKISGGDYRLNPSLSYDEFMRDDRVLMIAGSPENRESLAKMLFSRKKDGGEGWKFVGKYHRMTEERLATMGRLVSLDSRDLGFGASDQAIFNYVGRFIVAEARSRVPEKSPFSRTVKPTLERVVATSF